VARSAIVCPSCGRKLAVKGRLAGRKAFCPGCGEQLSGPAPLGGSPTRAGSSAVDEPERPPRSWAATAFAVLALGVGIAAIPVAVVPHQHLALALAGLGVLLGFVGMFTAVLRGRGAGFGLSLAGAAVCGAALFATLLLFGRGTPSDDRQAGTDNPRQADDDKGEKNSAEKPGSRPDPTDGIRDKKVAELVRDLMSERDADRIRAAEQLGKLREEARPAARALCEAALTPEESVRRAALEALEKVHPALYKPVLTLLVDSGQYNHHRAVEAIRLMGKDGNAAAPVLLAHLRWHCQLQPSGRVFALQRPDEELAGADIAALRAVAPDDPGTANLLTELATYESQLSRGWIRQAAVAALGDVANSQPSRRREIVKTLMAAAQFQPSNSQRPDAQTTIAALNALAVIGPDPTEAVPEVKKLKLSPDANIRQAAGAALEKIDKER
jgi:hypothetical protein